MHKGVLTAAFVALLPAVLAGLIQYRITTDNPLDNLLYDFTLAQNSWFKSAAPTFSDHRVVVVALDERSHSAEELKGYGLVGIAPKFAELIEALVDGGAKGIGFDYVFAYPDDYLVDGHEVPLRKQILKHRQIIALGRTEKLDVQPRFLGLFSGLARVGSIDMSPDSDNKFRRVPLRIKSRKGSGSTESIDTLSAVLTRIAGIEGDVPEKVILAPERSLEWLPTYSLIDVLRCHSSGQSEFIRKIFKDKIVLVGNTMAGLDRLTTSDRFMVRPKGIIDSEFSSDVVCQLNRQSASNPTSRSVPGVYLHAAAVNTLLSQRVVTFNPRVTQVLIAVAAVLAAAIVAYLVGPWLGLSLSFLGALVLHGAASVMLEYLYWIPVGSISISMVLAALFVYAVRYVFVDRQQRLVQRSFNNYLSDHLVQQIVDTRQEPTLGGETRDITVMFADLTGFTMMSERVSSEELVALTNTYLKIISEEVHRTDGYVDKFIGDAVMAMWGAPAENSKHAEGAVRAALRATQRVQKLKEEAESRGEPAFGLKVGIASGSAVVGNVGVEGRLNYTAVGSVVNIASRLEGVTADYGCPIVVGRETMSQSRGTTLFNEVDKIRVKGSDRPISIYQPLGDLHTTGPEYVSYQQIYTDALSLYRAQEFEKAIAMWNSVDRDSFSSLKNKATLAPARIMAHRAKTFVAQPPPDDWDGVWTKTTK